MWGLIYKNIIRYYDPKTSVKKTDWDRQGVGWMEEGKGGKIRTTVIE